MRVLTKSVISKSSKPKSSVYTKSTLRRREKRKTRATAT